MQNIVPRETLIKEQTIKRTPNGLVTITLPKFYADKMAEIKDGEMMEMFVSKEDNRHLTLKFKR